MKKRIRFLALLATLAVSLLFYHITRDEPSTVPLLLTVKAEELPVIVAETIKPAEGEATLDGYPCVVTAQLITPTMKWDAARGIRFPSSLYCDICFTLRVNGHARESIFYAAERLLSVGKRMRLSSSAFETEVVILEIKTGQVG